MAKEKNVAIAPKEGEAVGKKLISASLADEVKKASEGLKGNSYGGITAAKEKIKSAITAGDRPKFFDPSLSQYKEGMYLYFDPEAPVREVPVGKTGRTAIVATVVAGSMIGGELIFNKPFNFYPTTARKQIQVTEADGEPTLDENKNQILVPKVGNPIWEKCRGMEDEADILEYFSGKTVKVTKVLRDFGPSDFVDNRPTSHKLTGVPQFEEA